MKLYYMPGACSLAINIGLREAKLPFELIPVDYATQTLPDGSDYHLINRGGFVPTLQLDNNSCLSEVIAIYFYIAMNFENSNLLGLTSQRQEAMEWLSFVATEAHKSFSPLFRAETPEAFHKPGQYHLQKRLSVIEQQLSKQPFLVGSEPTAADFYLFTIYRWMPDIGLHPNCFPNIVRHNICTSKLPSVQDALLSEGLVSSDSLRESIPR